MPDVPYPITADNAEELRRQVWNLIREIFEERMGGLNIGDVFQDSAGVLTLRLGATNPCLQKLSSALQVEVKPVGGLEATSLGLAADLKPGGSLAVDSEGIYVTTPAQHDAVTLAASAGTLLGLSTQELSLDSQTANYVFVGPTSGGADVPTFRALVNADLGTTLGPTFDHIHISTTVYSQTFTSDYAGLVNAITISAANISATGAATDISIELIPKGSGKTHTTYFLTDHIGEHTAYHGVVFDNDLTSTSAISSAALKAGTSTKNTHIAACGRIFSTGAVASSRIDLTQITANTVTLVVGSSTDTVSDLQYEYDGNIYHVDEVTGTPGLDLIVDFVSVTSFSLVRVKGSYVGSATHAMVIQMYDWNDAHWHPKGYMGSELYDATAGNELISNHEFIIVSDRKYIGTGANDGKVRVRLLHPIAGNASHDLYVDCVALYR